MKKIPEEDLKEIDKLLEFIGSWKSIPLTSKQWAEIEANSDKIREENRRKMDALTMSYERLHKQYEV